MARLGFLPTNWRSGIIQPEMTPLEAVLQVCKEFDPKRVVAYNFKSWVLYFAYKDTDGLTKCFIALTRAVCVTQKTNSLIFSTCVFAEWETPYYFDASAEVLKQLSPNIGQNEADTLKALSWRLGCAALMTRKESKPDRLEGAFDWQLGCAKQAAMEVQHG